MVERSVLRVFYGMDTMDGAGVRLRRLFGNREAKLFDPFLLLDLFGSTDPEQYLPGFPMHPHRGIETITYMLDGTVRHSDSMGSSGFIGPGDVQWMTAGSGIIHEEMPQPSPMGVRGLQLWVNLPRSEKMRDPSYRGYSSADIPLERIAGGEARVVAGSFGRSTGPVRGVERDPFLIVLRLGADGSAMIDAPRGQTAFACVFEGGLVDPLPPEGEAWREPPYCALFADGEALRLKAGPRGCALLLARAQPLGESIAWRGPIVMNDEAELDQAFHEYANGSFVRKKAL
jgi:quercetin 2,3-dioxygenase